ncbi:hypothetical protein GCM10023116_16020 [Kistimonas scapharcae]|uniref:Uncharacterized protein n=1 Tax=Kistimonas scapharcae TaxID=1036133 RepID=A0ABP8V1N5_9GAMM
MPERESASSLSENDINALIAGCSSPYAETYQLMINTMPGMAETLYRIVEYTYPRESGQDPFCTNLITSLIKTFQSSVDQQYDSACRLLMLVYTIKKAMQGIYAENDVWNMTLSILSPATKTVFLRICDHQPQQSSVESE